MRLLALDTATEACSVALADGDAIHERWVEAPREHGDRLFAMIEAVLADAGLGATELDALAFGRGPGAFTGVRIATGVAQGIAAGLELAVLRVSTLAALAQGVYRRHGHARVLAALDARMGEVYWGAYALDDAGVMRALAEECVAPPDAVPVPAGDGWYGAGTGWARYPQALARRAGPALAGDLGRALPAARDLLPAAAADFMAGLAVPPAEALPVYLRDRVADKPRQR